MKRKVDLREPVIRKKDVLILEDRYFKPANVCIVTGAASGIGRATTLAMAANGVKVLCADVDEAGGEATVKMAQKSGGHAQFFKVDLTRDDQMEACVAQAAKLGMIKFLANIAGIQHIDAIENFPMAKYDLMQSIMLRAPFCLAKLVIPHIRKSRDGVGAIGNMASVHAHITTINKPVYNIVKFGLRGLTQSIAAEGDGKIRSFSISTGFISTPLALKQIPSQAEQRGITPEAVVRDVMLGKSRIKEMMTPIEVANLFVFGFSQHSRFLIGGDLLYDGGIVKTYL
ncbi:MAG: SDR family oxidoreductase [Proteobacteria bacterium]|nr:SDR family oxidoreductase [Pseudomonadota bacterium]MBU4582382.1 SDR family oxidoreductase [Pseudomonadota bacterium]